MRRTNFLLVTLPTLLLVVGLTTGCATQREIEAVRVLAQEAKDRAERANQLAAEASQLAQSAQAEARGAVSAAAAAKGSAVDSGNLAAKADKNAREALDAARDAKRCCDAVTTKIDRVFKKALQK